MLIVRRQNEVVFVLVVAPLAAVAVPALPPKTDWQKHQKQETLLLGGAFGFDVDFVVVEFYFPCGPPPLRPQEDETAGNPEQTETTITATATATTFPEEKQQQQQRKQQQQQQQ